MSLLGKRNSDYHELFLSECKRWRGDNMIVKRYICTNCNSAMETESDLELHIIKIHEGLRACNHCGIILNDIYSMSRHIIEKHKYNKLEN